MVPTPGKTRWSCVKRVGFRVGTILLGLAPLLLCEGVVRLGGWGRDLPTGDPYVEFDPTRPLFVLNPDESRYVTAPNRKIYFAPQSFPATKATNEFRMFALGGSTVQGRPFSAETAFPAWLQLGLRAADAHTQWTMVNCGGISYASYRLIPILREVLQYQPDLILICTGHNEFLEQQMVRAIDDLPARLSRGRAWLGRWHTFRVLAAWARNGPSPGPGPDPAGARMPPEVGALLDYQDGLAYYQRDDARRRQTLMQFERNLERLVRDCRDAGVPVLLVSPVSNLKDSPPFKVAQDRSLDPAGSRAFAEAWDLARASGLSASQRNHALRRAISIDPRHAGTHFLLGMNWWEQGRYPSALAAFIRAKEEDLCPLRMLEPMRESVQAVARTRGLPLVDAQALIAARSIGGIPDNAWMLDHVHPTIRGHRVIADALLLAMADAGYLTLSPGWEERRDQFVEQQFASLDDAYHARGQRRLVNLRRWARGRSTQLRQPDPAPSPP